MYNKAINSDPKNHCALFMERWTMPAKAQHPLTPVTDQARGHIHQLLHHRAQAPPLRLMVRRGVRADQPGQPDVTQDVVDQGRHREDQVVGGELPRLPASQRTHRGSAVRARARSSTRSKTWRNSRWLWRGAGAQLAGETPTPSSPRYHCVGA